MRRVLTPLIWLGAALALAGCAGKADDFRLPAKPDELVMNLVSPGADGSARSRLGQARISTKSGDIHIIEPDGSITELALDGESPDPFAVSEADLMLLNANLDLDLSHLPAMAAARKGGPTAQERALARFASLTQPLLPRLPEGLEVDPKMFKGVEILGMSDPRKAEGPQPGGAVPGLVKVRANLDRGVDADLAFAYATCALAGWAESQGTGFARHVMTERTKRNGQVQVGVVFTLSESRPMGLKVMDTDQTLQECKARGIPAV